MGSAVHQRIDQGTICRRLICLQTRIQGCVFAGSLLVIPQTVSRFTSFIIIFFLLLNRYFSGTNASRMTSFISLMYTISIPFVISFESSSTSG